MTTLTTPRSRLAGALYLVPTLLGPFSMVYVPGAVVTSVAGVRSADLATHLTLFRLGIASDLVIVLVELLLTAVLFVLFERTNRALSVSAAFARLAMAVLQAANVVLLVAAGLARDGSVLWLLDLHAQAAHVWEVCFALHCALLGALVWRHGAMPRVLGALLGVAGAGYLVNGLGSLLLPDAAPVFAQVVAVTAIAGEVPFVGWLLVRGATVGAIVTAPPACSEA